MQMIIPGLDEKSPLAKEKPKHKDSVSIMVYPDVSKFCWMLDLMCTCHIAGGPLFSINIFTLFLCML